MIFSTNKDGIVSHHRLEAKDLGTVVDTLRADPAGPTFERRILPGRQNVKLDDLEQYLSAEPNGEIVFSEGVASFGVADPDSDLPESTRRMFDAEAIAALSCVSSYGENVYQFYATPGEKGLFRRQAASSFPMFASEIATRIRLKMAVDSRKSPGDVFGTTFGTALDGSGEPLLDKGRLKKFSKFPHSDQGIPVQTIVSALAELPVDWYPQSDEDWDAFLTVVEGVYRHLVPATGIGFETFVSSSKGKWSEFVTRIAKAYADTFKPDDMTPEQMAAWKPVVDTSRDAFVSACCAAVDMIDAFRDHVVLPACGRSVMEREPYVSVEKVMECGSISADILVGGKSLVGIMEMQRHWHTQAPAIREAIYGTEATVGGRGQVKDVAEDGWPPLCDIYQAPNGIYLVPLTDPRELEAEGDELHHCVGGYSAGCKSGRSHIISVRDVAADGTVIRRYSTAEVTVDANFEKLSTRQHRGRSNGTPAAAAEEAFGWFKTEIEQRRIPLNKAGIMSYVAGARKRVEEIESYSNYDFRDDVVFDAAYDAWKPYLREVHLGPTSDFIVETPEILAMGERMAPGYRNSFGM